MTDQRFQDDELEFDDEFVLEDVELDADEFLDEPEDAEAPAAPPLVAPVWEGGSEEPGDARSPFAAQGVPLDDEPDLAPEVEERSAFGLADPGLPPVAESAGHEDVLGFDQEFGSDRDFAAADDSWSVDEGAEASWQPDDGFVGEALEAVGDDQPVADADPFGWGSVDATQASPAAAFEGPEQALFDAAGAVGSDESRFDESGHWHGSAAAFEEIVGEVELAPQAGAWNTTDDDSEFDVEDLEALDAVEIERLDADDFDELLDAESYDEPESLVEYLESAGGHQPVFAEDDDLADFDAEPSEHAVAGAYDDDDDLGLEPMPSIALDGFDLDESEDEAFEVAAAGFAAAAMDHAGVEDTTAPGDDWDLTLRADGSPMAEVEEESPQDWGEETFVVEDPAEAAAEAEPAGSFGGGRFEPFAANAMAGAMAVPQGEGWESVELGVGAGDEGDETWEVSADAPEEVDPEAYDEDDPIYGEEAMAASGTVGVEESWSRQNDEADWSELEENYVDGETEPEIHVIGGPGSQRRGGGRLLAAAAVLLVGLGGATGTIAWLHPEWLGLQPAGPAGVERIAIARPELALELARPELEVRVADVAQPVGGTGPDGPVVEQPSGPGGAEGTQTPGGVRVAGTDQGRDPTDVDTTPGAGDGAGTVGTPDQPAAGSAGEELVADAAPVEFTPIEIGESLEMRGPSSEPAAGTIDSVRIGMRAWAQLANEAVFVGTVRQIEASFVTLRMETGEITLERDEIVAIVPISDAEDDPVEIENGFVRLGDSGTLFGRILRNNGGEHVILETTDSRVSLPLESIDSVGIRTDAGIVVVDDDDEWLEERARRRLSGAETRQETRRRATDGSGAGDASRTRSTLPVLPAVPPAGGR